MLRELQFVDLQLGPGFSEMTGIPGRNAARAPIPPGYMSDAEALKRQCIERYELLAEREFSVHFDGLMMRVTVLPSLLSGEPVFFIRRMAAQVRDFYALGLPEEVEKLLMRSGLAGTVLFVGEQRMGKTSTAASYAKARLEAHGGLSIAVEQPPETVLDGLHGEGRLVQVPVSEKHGGFARQLEGVMRTGAAMVLIGEILNADVGELAVFHGMNGMLVAATMHASAPAEAVARLASLVPNKLEAISAGLTAVIHQRIVTNGGFSSLAFETLCMDGPEKEAIQTKIRCGQFGLLRQDVDTQMRRMGQ
ncbi:Flp pilus assembly complex ATPase component TadA [Xanthomonas euvesicatoria pv. allii]|uniref:ATPase, T2SS/T4P/T4SS family n=1 Tax=Xanthomonas euvesicatoria TaxID=456327 RepID=UPI002405BB4B|nr:Flp pilus assembly complex ATPase component TadA [Xanthomonas euvesicatoria pv. allii]